LTGLDTLETVTMFSGLSPSEERVLEREPELTVLDPIYLPFTESALSDHFRTKDATGHPLAHYIKSVSFRSAENPPKSKRAVQMEKDERFWTVTCLKSLWDGRNDDGALWTLLDSSLGQSPVCSTWKDALQEPLKLFFEVRLPAPKGYRTFLCEHSKVRNLGIRHPLQQPQRTRFEGDTKVDAILISSETGVAVIFEAKVLSDVSCHITYDVSRNQIARNIDVMLEPPKDGEGPPLSLRKPELTYFVLLTPAAFKNDEKENRLYGWLMPDYMSTPTLLQRHLSHRHDETEVAEASKRIGWLTWEDCCTLMPCSCPWLSGQTWLDGDG
jgi:hypothetical protein